jgi:lipoyl synthase
LINLPFQKDSELPQQVRVSLGTAMVLGLLEGKIDVVPTTAYLMTYRAGKCSANCGFCPQARSSKSNAEMLSRVSWPTFPTSLLLTALQNSVESGKIKRVCIQALNYPEVFVHLEALVKEVKKRSAVAVSVSCQPQTKGNLELLASAGVDRLGIALDAATQEVFDKVKGADAGASYRWNDEFRQLADAVTIFGRGNVSTHVIVGLGETEQQAVAVIQRCVDMTVLPALFAFTPVRGTALEGHAPPKLASYRRIQLARFLIVNGEASYDNMQFDGAGGIIGFGVTKEALNVAIDSGLPFQTSGCPDCNRPFYNEKPSGPFHNYPKKLGKKETEKVKKELQ